MKKIGTTALAVLTAISISALSAGCEKKAETKKPETKTPAEGEKKPEGGH